MGVMERRDFLAALGVGAAFGPSLAGCAGGPHTMPELSAREATDLLGRLDRGLASVREIELGALAMAPWQARPEAPDRLFRTGIEALVIADVARSIPEGVRVTGELRERLLTELPILTECTASYHAMLSSAPPAVRRNVERRFREDPDVAMDFVSRIDDQARSIGISNESRLRLRQHTVRVGSQIRRQSANALVDDTLAKVERAVRHSGGDVARLRDSRTDAFVDAMWRQVDETGASATASPFAYSPPTSPSMPSGAYDPEVPPASETPTYSEPPGDRELEIGGILMGVGVGVFGIGTLIGGAAGSWMWGAIIAATPGSILVIVGLVFLIIGAAQNARG